MQFKQTKQGLTVLVANTGGEYQEHAKEYVVNMCRNRKMVHKKNGCYQSKYLFESISFESLEEVKKLPFKVNYCELCFPNQKDIES
ncbi:hypothetical protein ACTNB0_08700 [Lachnospiraceae bacterium HCP28S3_F9]